MFRKTSVIFRNSTPTIRTSELSGKSSTPLSTTRASYCRTFPKSIDLQTSSPLRNFSSDNKNRNREFGLLLFDPKNYRYHYHSAIIDARKIAHKGKTQDELKTHSQVQKEIKDQGPKKFHIGEILSIVTGLMLSPTGMEGVYNLIDYMTEDATSTHQIPGILDECKIYILQQYPDLAKVNLKDHRDKQKWTQAQIARFGEYLSVNKLPEAILKHGNNHRPK